MGKQRFCREPIRRLSRRSCRRGEPDGDGHYPCSQARHAALVELPASIRVPAFLGMVSRTAVRWVVRSGSLSALILFLREQSRQVIETLRETRSSLLSQVGLQRGLLTQARCFAAVFESWPEHPSDQHSKGWGPFRGGRGPLHPLMDAQTKKQQLSGAIARSTGVEAASKDSVPFPPSIRG